MLAVKQEEHEWAYLLPWWAWTVLLHGMELCFVHPFKSISSWLRGDWITNDWEAGGILGIAVAQSFQITLVVLWEKPYKMEMFYYHLPQIQAQVNLANLLLCVSTTLQKTCRIVTQSLFQVTAVCCWLLNRYTLWCVELLGQFDFSVLMDVKPQQCVKCLVKEKLEQKGSCSVTLH